jgi:hypothetical protein
MATYLVRGLPPVMIDDYRIIHGVEHTMEGCDE